MINPAPETPREHDLRRLRTLYRALGDETRLRMIGLLAEIGPMPVNELSSRVGLSQPLISWHLRILRLAGVVDTRAPGPRRPSAACGRPPSRSCTTPRRRLIGGTAGVRLAPARRGRCRMSASRAARPRPAARRLGPARRGSRRPARAILAPVVRLAIALHLTPNTITVIGLADHRRRRRSSSPAAGCWSARRC